MIELGAIVGVVLASFSADRYSRRRTIMMSVPLILSSPFPFASNFDSVTERRAVGIFLVGGIVQTVSVGYWMLIVGRFVGGIGVGALSMTTPMSVSSLALIFLEFAKLREYGCGVASVGI